MPKKMRHSKFRNTGILFELLTKQITADIIAGKENSEAKTLLFKYFKENTELGKEWRLYSLLLNEKVKDLHKAERFLGVIVEQRKKISNSSLSREKYNLIKEIKELYPIDEFLKSNIKNYRALASIFKLFENASYTNESFDVSEIYQSKTCIVEHIADKPRKVLTESDELLELYAQQNEEVRLLSYKLLVDGMNQKYQTLNDDQRLVLKEYINNVSNTNSLGTFLLGQVSNIKKQLSELVGKVEDSDVVRIKINEVTKQLDRIKPTKIVKDNQIMVVLLSYELIKEIKSKINNE